MADTAIFDVDGTLVDTNYQHAIAWARAFARFDVVRPLWRTHRGIGMGGDTFVPAVAGDDVEREHGDELRSAWSEEFGKLIDECQPFEGAHELLQEVADRGFTVVLGSSGRTEQVERFLDLVDGRGIAAAWTTPEDAQKSKPGPDIVQAALQRGDASSGVMIGDSTWDVIAAGKRDVPTIAVRTGGFSTEELTEAGAVAVYDSLVELRQKLDETPLARPSR